MTVETVVSASTLTPGTYVKVDLLGGAGGASSPRRRVLLVGPKSSSGTGSTDTLYKAMTGPDQVATYAGPGTPLHLAAKRMFKRNARLELDLLLTPDGSGASSSGTHTFAGTPTAAYNVRFEIGDATINVPWAVGESASTFATRARSYIGNATNDVPVTAGGAGGAVLLTAKIPGPWGQDIRARVTLELGAGGTVNSTDRATYTFAGGTTEPSVATALTKVATRRYYAIVAHVSNAEASLAGAGVPSAVKTHLDTYKLGKDALLQRCILGNTSTAVSSATTGAVYRNSERFQTVFAMNGRALPVEWAAFEAADAMELEELRFGNPNRTNTEFSDFGAPFDIADDKPTATEVETALNGGVSIIDYTDTGIPHLVMPVTEHSLDANSNADQRCLFVSDVTGADIVADDLRVALEQQYPQKKVVADRDEEDSDPLPSDTVEIREVREFVHARLREWVDRGTLRGDFLEEAITAGTLVVAIDPDNESKVDLVIPYRVVRPWTQTSLLMKRAA